MSDATTNSADLFEIIRTTRSMRRLKPDPVPTNSSSFTHHRFCTALVIIPTSGQRRRTSAEARSKPTVFR